MIFLEQTQTLRTMRLKQTRLTNNFGLTIEPEANSSFADFDAEQISDLFKANRALYFKGWNLKLEDFQELSSKLCHNFSCYEGGGFRFKELDREFVSSDKTIMTTTGHTQGFPIPLHGEMHYLGTPPPLIWFYCKTPGGTTGQTTLCDGLELAQRLPEKVKKHFRGKNIKYSRFLSDGLWQSSFLTDDPEKAMEICKQQKVDFKYDKVKSEFITEYVTNPLPDTGYATGPKYINNILNIASVEWAFDSGWVKENFASDFGERCPMIVRMEDGSRIPSEILDEVRDTAESLTVNIDWNSGEVLMVDNLSVLHGRRESLNPEREVFVRMGDAKF